MENQPDNLSDQTKAINFIQEIAEESTQPIMITEDPLALCLAHFGLDFDIEGSIREVNTLLDFVPSFPDLWKLELDPLSSSDSLLQPDLNLSVSDNNQPCPLMAMPPNLEILEHFEDMEINTESVDVVVAPVGVVVSPLFDDYPVDEVFWHTKERVRSLFWIHHAPETIGEPEFERLDWGVSPSNDIFSVEFEVLNYKKRRKWE